MGLSPQSVLDPFVQGPPAPANSPSLQPDKLRRFFFTDKKHKS